MILREAAGLAVAGVAGGCIAAGLVGRWIQSMLFGTTAADPLVLSAAAIIMVGVSLVATLVPARQASQADPSELLRAE